MSQVDSLKLIDSHAHLDDPSLRTQLDAVLLRASEAGVAAVVTIATDPQSSRNAVALASSHPGQIFAAVGFQPNHCRDLGEQDWSELLPLVDAPGVVAIGETGLDRYWNDCPFEIQKDWFQKHLELSRTTGLPLIIHMRDCESDIVAFVRENRRFWPLRGIMHSFTGSLETAQACLESGLHISFAGMLTYRNSANLREIARQIPLERLLVETDSPYLPPEPVRKQRPNEPANVLHTANCLAMEKGLSLAELARATTANAIDLLRLPGSLLGDFPAGRQD